MNTAEIIDLSVPRRRYYSAKCNLMACPECGSSLKNENCTILLCVKSETDEAEFITNLSGSYFCNNCPVVVFDSDIVEQAAKIGIRGYNLRYLIAGIVDLDSIPEEKRHLAIGGDDNPVPLIYFLPDLNTKTLTAEKKPGRNGSCTCGSGKKYKKCCGK